jgi:hypothetical protein
VLRKASRNKDADDIPDVRADEPERAMQQFTDGLKRVLSAPKARLGKARKIKRRSPT